MIIDTKFKELEQKEFYTINKVVVDDKYSAIFNEQYSQSFPYEWRHMCIELYKEIRSLYTWHTHKDSFNLPIIVLINDSIYPILQLQLQINNTSIEPSLHHIMNF